MTSMISTRLVATRSACLLSVSPDGRRVVTKRGDTTVLVRDAATGEKIAVMQHTAPVTSAGFSPDGRCVVTGSVDAIARVWGAVSGDPVPLQLTHEDVVNAVAFSSDGLWIATASDDGTARVWSAATGEQLMPPLVAGGAMRCAAFSPDGTTLAVADGAGSAYLIKLQPSTYTVEEEILLAQILSGYRFDARGAHLPLKPGAFRTGWERLRSQCPDTFRCSAAELAQWHSRLAPLLDGEVGVFGDGARRLRPLTVCTFESAFRHMDTFGDRFRLLVVDEVHHFAGGARAEALEMCAAPCRLGLTATPPADGAATDRPSQLEPAVEGSESIIDPELAD